MSAVRESDLLLSEPPLGTARNAKLRPADVARAQFCVSLGG